MRGPVLTVLTLLCGLCGAARQIACYDFTPSAEPGMVADRSGFGHHGRLVGDARLGSDGALACGGAGYVELPGGAQLFGTEAVRGSVSVWVRPDFSPEDLATGLWDGYSMIFYAMQTDGNALPDGSQEIGLWCHGAQLLAKVSANSFGPTFMLPSPLRKGIWTHLVLCWGPRLKALYVDGQLADRDDTECEPPHLDEFPATLGQHASSRRWAWRGDLADCRLFDDALTEAEVRALAAARYRPPAAPAAPAPEPLAGVDWGLVWLGPRQVTVQLRDLPAATDWQLLCEVLSDAGREQFPPVPAQPGTVSVPYEVGQEGWNRVNLLIREAGTQEVVAGRSAFVNIPWLSPTLTDTANSLAQVRSELTTQAMPAAAAGAIREVGSVLRARLEAIQEAASQATTPQRWEELIAEARELARRAAALAARSVIYARGSRNGQAPDFGLGVDHPLRKYLKEDTFAGKLERPVELKAARHEYEAAQVFIFALDRDLEDVLADASDLIGPGDAVIPRQHITWNRVGYVQTRPPTYQVRHVGLWPDPLLPPGPFNVPRGEFRIVWLTVYVPPDTPAGDYHGSLRIAPANASARELPIRLHVWDFALPEKSSLVTAFGLNCMGDYVSRMDVDRYVANAFAHRISLGFPGVVSAAAQVRAAGFNLGGQTLSFRVRAEPGEGAELGPLFLITTPADGTRPGVYGPLPLRADEWSEVSVTLPSGQPVAAVRFEYRNAGPVSLLFGPLMLGERPFDAMDQPEWWHATGPWTSLRGMPGGLQLDIAAPAPDEPFISRWPAMERLAAETPADTPFSMDFSEFDERTARYLERGVNCICIPVPGCPRGLTEEQARKLAADSLLGPIARAYHDHLKDMGWLDYAYTYVIDEPEPDDYAGINVFHGTIRQWAPGLANMVTARHFPPELKYVDIWCPEVYSFDPVAAAREQAKGKRVWWYPAYSTRRPFPNFWIDYPAIDNRVIFWLTWKHKLDGLLYWSITAWWRTNPWESGMTFPGANGDGSLLYPGEDGGPVNSLRWECIRDGAEDYEYFVLLKEAVARAEGEGAGVPAGLLERARELLTIDESVARSWEDWNEDPLPLLAARDEMGQLIERLREVVGP